MKISSLLIVGRDPEARDAAILAARSAYPSAEVEKYPGLAAAVRRERKAGGELLLLLRPSAEELREATRLRDSRGMPRWPVVVFGEGTTGASLPFVQPADWNSQLARIAVEYAAVMHELAWENERLRGDLQTLSRRFSHDLRAPLNCLSTASEGLARISAAPSPSHEALAKTLLDAVGEVATLIDRVSFLLKATAAPPARKRMDMRDVVLAALQRLETRIKKQGATVVQPDQWPHLESVDSWLEVIWGNLIGNSLVHAGPAPRIELGWIRDSVEYLFRVRDYGPGLSPEKRSGLFAPFDQLHQLNAPRGLGLPIVHRLVELLGGRCFYEAPIGGGACFYFSLPAPSS